MNDTTSAFPPRALKDLWAVQEAIAAEVAHLTLREAAAVLHERAHTARVQFEKRLQTGELPIPIYVVRDRDAYPPRALRDLWAARAAMPGLSAHEDANPYTTETSGDLPTNP